MSTTHQPTLWIVGAGAVGQGFARRFAAHARVQLIGRKDWAALPAEPSALPDLVLLACKGYHLQSVMQEVAAHIPSRHPVALVCLQNGFEAIREAKRHLGEISDVWSWGRALIWTGYLPHSTGGVQEIGTAKLVVADVDPEWITLFRSAGFVVEQGASVLTIEWQKAFANAVVNLVASFAQSTNRVVIEDPDVQQIAKAVYDEIVEVSLSQGQTPLSWGELLKITQQVGDNANSLWVDLLNGRPTETRWIQRWILDHGKETGLHLPWLEKMVKWVEIWERRRTLFTARALLK